MERARDPKMKKKMKKKKYQKGGREDDIVSYFHYC